MSEAVSVTYCYAPMTGDVMRKDNGVMVKTTSWDEYHKIKNEFLSLQTEGKLNFVETTNYGHEMFHGHTGRVDTYSVKS